MSSIALYQVIGLTIVALTAVVFGMLAVCAFASQRHWFIRTAAVGAALAALVVLPAHEYAVLFGVGTAFFVTGLAVWQRVRDCRSDYHDIEPAGRGWPRIALRDVFLLTFLVAAILAVVVHTPNRNPVAWLFTLIDGIVLATMGLACFWLAVGRTRLIFRLAAAPLILAFNIIAAHTWLWWFTYGLTSFSHTSPLRELNPHWPDRFRRYWMVAWPRTIREWAIAVAVATAAFIVWLVVTKKAGWFPRSGKRQHVPSPDSQVPNRATLLAKSSAALLTAAIAALPLYVWYLLMTPPAIPAEAHQSNQNYQQLVEAADELYRAHAGDATRWSRASDAQFAALVSGDEAIWQRVRAAIAGGCQFPWQLVDEDENTKALRFLGYVFYARVARGDGSGAILPRLTAALDAMRLAQMELHSSSGRTSPMIMETELEVWKIHGQMTAEQCKQVAQAILRLDSQLEPPEDYTARSRRILQNGGWKFHLDQIAWDLARVSRSTRINTGISRQAFLSRMLLLELAIHAFKLEQGRPPAALAELAPTYVAAIPGDPFGDGPFHYKLIGGSHLLYSVGVNGVDDGGQHDPKEFFMLSKDIPSSRFFPTTTPAATTKGGNQNSQETKPEK